GGGRGGGAAEGWSGDVGCGSAGGQHPDPEGRRAPHKGRRDRRRHAAEGRVVAPGLGGRHRQGPHHRRKPGARDPARALHAGRHRNGDCSVRSTAMDTKTLLEWSAKYHTPNYGARAPIVLVRGDGVRVWDSDGREYLDFGAGIAVTSLGHCHPRVTGAIQEAAATLLHVSNLYHSAPQIHLAKLLIEHSFADRVFFSNSGAEANEAALKLARKY